MVCSVGLLFAVAVGVVGQVGSSHSVNRLETEQLARMVVVLFVMQVGKMLSRSPLVRWTVVVVKWLLRSACIVLM